MAVKVRTTNEEERKIKFANHIFAIFSIVDFRHSLHNTFGRWGRERHCDYKKKKSSEAQERSAYTNRDYVHIVHYLTL